MKKGQGGLTLIEIMIVLVILGVVMTTLGSRIFGAGDKAKRRLTEISLTQLKATVEEFKLRYNVYPANIDELTNCTETTGSNCLPIVSDPATLRDAWGNFFKYQGGHNSRTYKITSLGADGREGGSAADSDFSIEGP